MPRKDSSTGPISAQAQQDQVSEGIENFELPRSVVTKIAKSAMHENSKLQKEAVLALVKSSTVFINYLAATAHDVAQSKQHKSISASDVLKALEIVEFGDLVDGLQGELQVYRENTKADRTRKSTSASAPVKSTSASTSTSTPPSPKSKSKGKGKASASAVAAIAGAGVISGLVLDPTSISAGPAIGTFTNTSASSLRPPHPLSTMSLPGEQDEDIDDDENEVIGEDVEDGVEADAAEEDGESSAPEADLDSEPQDIDIDEEGGEESEGVDEDRPVAAAVNGTSNEDKMAVEEDDRMD